jgi:hypothetical protein
MNLDEAQTDRVREWINQGLKVAEIQTRLAEELGVTLTYMEARLLLDDLRLKPKDPPPAKISGNTLVQPSAGTTEAPGKKPRGIAVAVDEITRPGALASGKVTFRDGEQAEWQLDQFGRLSLVPKRQGYKPAQVDVMDFQTELESVLSRLGY